MAKKVILQVQKSDGWYVGKAKDCLGVISQGRTIEELKENIIDAHLLMYPNEPREIDIEVVTI